MNVFRFSVVALVKFFGKEDLGRGREKNREKEKINARLQVMQFKGK